LKNKSIKEVSYKNGINLAKNIKIPLEAQPTPSERCPPSIDKNYLQPIKIKSIHSISEWTHLAQALKISLNTPAVIS
jgi:hypothetical protein